MLRYFYQRTGKEKRKSMRVIAGIARSLKLETLEGLGTRPTPDRIKETLFNMIQYELQGCNFIDLYSGSGAIGIEALSRGAAKVYLIENNPKACDCIQRNLTSTKLLTNAIVRRQDAILALKTIEDEIIDFIFLDPPYGLECEQSVMQVLQNVSYVSDDTTIIVEATLKTSFDFVDELGFEVIKEKKYKTNKHIFIRRRN